MRPNWVHGQHPPACTCAACARNQRSKGYAPRKSSRSRRSRVKDQLGNEERIQQECEVYIDGLCKKFSIRVPILVIDDTMYNPGACGEAGKLVIRVQRRFILAANRQNREAVLRHELAHISVHNTLGDVEIHGPEFKRELNRLGGDRITGNAGQNGEVAISPVRQVIGAAVIGLVLLVLLQGWFVPLLPDWLAQPIAPILASIADFVWAAYWQWPVWTALSSILLGFAVVGIMKGVDSAVILFMLCALAASFVTTLMVSVPWAHGEGLPAWAAPWLIPLGIPPVAPDNWNGIIRVMAVIGSAVGGLLATGMIICVPLWLLSSLWRTILRLFSRKATKDGIVPAAKYWRGRQIE